MPGVFSAAFGRVKSFWAQISVSQRIFVGILAAMLVAVFFAAIFWLNRTEMQTLYSNLSPEDANRVVKMLESQKVPYSLESNGSTIMVPVDKVHGLRLKVAGEGALVGQGIGFEVFDNVQVGQTDFAQKIQYMRAMQGELARTIMEFPAVESARVHLVLPQRSLFIEDQQKPSASVALKLVDGKKMDNKDVQAIVNLVTMAVEGLDKAKVSITDTAGRTLFQPEEANSITGLTTPQMEHKQLTQQSLERRIEELLTPVVGSGKVIAKVNADLDYSHKTIRKELYDPEKTVVRSEQRSEESQQGRANLESGVPEVNFRGDGLTGAISNQSGSRESRNTNFEINKEEQSIVSAIGDINRLTVAVVVDGSYQKNEAGEMIYVPRTDDELKRIRQLVANAVGFDSARGDTIEVSNMSFGEPEALPSQSLADLITQYALRIGKPLLNALLIFLFLAMVVRPVVLALIRPKVEGQMMEGLEGLPIGEERLALVESSEEELDALAVLEKIEDIKAHALSLSDQNMEQAIGIIRNWLRPEEKAAKAA